MKARNLETKPQKMEQLTLYIKKIWLIIWLIIWPIIWPRFGLLLNFIGALMMAFSIGKNPGEAHSTDKKERPVYLASVLRPTIFWLGTILFIVGFFISLFTIKT